MRASVHTLLNKRLLSWSISEIKQGQLWPVALALVLIIASIFAITALAQRMEQVVVKQGKQALTADSVFISSNPIAANFDTLAADNQLTVSSQTRFATMAFSDKGMKLVMVKGVDSRYPLQGELLLSNSKQTLKKVKTGELWLDERLFSQLEVKIGDAVTIGDGDFTITGRIIEEPGLSFNPFRQMPAVFIHSDDIAKTGAIQLGSRVRYSKFINGNTADIERLKKSIALTPSDQWRDQNSASRTNEVFQRTEQYLSLTVAIVIIMAATTLVLTCQHYVTTRRKTIAMLKSLGASRAWIARWLLIQVGVLLLLATVLGLSFGALLEHLLRIPLADLLPEPLPSYGMQPIWLSILTSLLIAIPALGIPLIGLINVSAANVMQEQAQPQRSKKRYALLLVPLLPMLLAYYDNLLVWIVFAGIAALFVALAAVSILLTRALSAMPLNSALKLALSRINRSGLATGVQFGALALSLMLLAIMWLVRTDLLADWQQTLSKDAPNAFALNIAPYDRQAYLETLDNNAIQRSQAYPIIRGRLATINGEDAKQRAQGYGGNDALNREINFTFASELPKYNQLLSGEWSGAAGVSVESDIGEDLGLKMGDELEFVINSIKVKAKVNSFRAVEWRDMKPNFYFIFTPDVLQNIPATYLVSFRVESSNDTLLDKLSRQHPTVSLIDIRIMGAKIQALLAQIVWSITLLAAIGVLSGLLLIFTLLRLSLKQRQEEIQLYRTLGASRKRVEQTIWAEYGVMALIASIVAVVGSELVVAAVMAFGFELPPQLHWQLWIMLPLVTFLTLMLVVSSLIKRLLIPINKAFG